MRDREGRSKQMRIRLVSVSLSIIAWVAAASCGGTTGTGPSYQDLCQRATALPCVHETVDVCVNNTQQVADGARQAGCSSLFDSGITCTDSHPDHCNGDVLAQDPACESWGQRLVDCMTKASPASLCALVGSDPCTQCICKKCPCDSECAGATQKWIDCDSACATSDAGDLTGCFTRCDATAPASFQTFMACSSSDVCKAACSKAIPDGGSVGP
jgi:hypothetical protein